MAMHPRDDVLLCLQVRTKVNRNRFEEMVGQWHTSGLGRNRSGCHLGPCGESCQEVAKGLDLEELYLMLDYDGSGAINSDEFCEGLIKAFELV
eukprot:5443968-Amphidinium_carterae.1